MGYNEPKRKSENLGLRTGKRPKFRLTFRGTICTLILILFISTACLHWTLLKHISVQKVNIDILNNLKILDDCEKEDVTVKIQKNRFPKRKASQNSFWVFGEKELKKQLKELEAQQNDGKLLRIPIANTFLGYDMPQYKKSDNWETDFRERLDLLKTNPEQIITTGASTSSKPIENNNIEPFPHPLSADENTHKVILKPTFGQHRPNSDAVFAFAEGYDLSIYVGFLESLHNTGFTGDVVLAVSSLNDLRPGVKEYLEGRQFGEMNVITYSVTWKCFDRQNREVKGAREGMSLCQTVGMYGNSNDEAVDDPRPPRPVATARYDLYWAWSLQYDSHSWIMLIDSRDTYFQLNPFATVPRKDKNVDDNDSGLLYFFGENKEARNLLTSSYNHNWLMKAYGPQKISAFKEEVIVCSGSTMGENIAIESYLRAMLLQYDETKCNLKGCDQGFHNYLYHSKTLDQDKFKGSANTKFLPPRRSSRW